VASMAMPDMTLGMTRSMVTMMQFNEQKQDYDKSVVDLEEGSEEYVNALNACHQRGAERCVNVANMHRGIYVKAAQFIASLRGGTGDRGIPKAYTEALSVFTDHAPHKSAGEIADVIKEVMYLGDWPTGSLGDMCSLKSIENEPIASASLAQVHRATLPNGSVVAVKVQYPELQKELASDFAVFRMMGAQIQQMAQGYDFMWVVDDFEKNLAQELDFTLEAKEGQATAEALKHRSPQVTVPKVYSELSSTKVLTMEFCDGLLKATDPRALQAAGLNVNECAQLLCETFAEMIFMHGRVHADPHAGNIYFRAMTNGDGSVSPQLVLLDHGLYYDLNENDVRFYFCKYWQACVAKDSQTMTELGTRFASALHKFLPVLLSPWFIFGGVRPSLHEIMSAAKSQLPETIGIRDVADFIVATRHGGANLIGLLHSLGYTRGLLEALEFPEGQRIKCMLKYAMLGDVESPSSPPRGLQQGEQLWMWWRMAILRSNIGLIAPFAGCLIRYAKADKANSAPPSWVLFGAPLALVSLGVVGFAAVMKQLQR